jgi:hypothetical protein
VAAHLAARSARVSGSHLATDIKHDNGRAVADFDDLA